MLREKIGLTGTKEGCGRGECGACTVLIDGVPRYACLTLAVEAEGASVTTVEGLLLGEAPGPVQSAFAEEDSEGISNVAGDLQPVEWSSSLLEDSDTQ